MEPQNIGSFPHSTAASQSQQPPRTRHSAGFEGQRNGGRDSDGSVSRFSVPSSTPSTSSSAGTSNHSKHRRNTTDPSAHNLPTRPNSSFQPPSNPNSTFVPSQQARYMTDPPPIDIYGFASPRPRSTAALATTATPAITPSRKTNVDAVPFGGPFNDIKEPTPRCVRCGTDKLSEKASDSKNGRQEMANNEQSVAASKPLNNQSVPQRSTNEPVAAKPSNDDRPWPPMAPPPSYSLTQRSSFNDKTDGALFGGSKVPNDYEHLERRRPNSQHHYRPMDGNDATRSAGTHPQPPPQPFNPNPSPPPPSPPLPPPPPPVSSADGATSPLYDFCSDRRPESSPFIQASNGVYIADGDDIIELQPSANASARATDGAKSDKPEAKKGEEDAKPAEVTEIPNTNFAIACMVTFCFNLPFGILAMYFSLRAVKAYQDGNPKLGEKRSRWSIVLSLLGITITTVIISSVVLYIAMQGQKRISKQKTFGAKSTINL